MDNTTHERRYKLLYVSQHDVIMVIDGIRHEHFSLPAGPPLPDNARVVDVQYDIETRGFSALLFSPEWDVVEDGAMIPRIVEPFGVNVVQFRQGKDGKWGVAEDTTGLQEENARLVAAEKQLLAECNKLPNQSIARRTAFVEAMRKGPHGITAVHCDRGAPFGWNFVSAADRLAYKGFCLAEENPLTRELTCGDCKVFHDENSPCLSAGHGVVEESTACVKIVLSDGETTGGNDTFTPPNAKVIDEGDPLLVVPAEPKA